jgi:hypothetical protein
MNRRIRLSPARAELLQAMLAHQIPAGRIAVKHPHQSQLHPGAGLRSKVPLTVHPGIGYDIIANHPMFNGAVIGRAAQLDFAQFGAAVEGLDGGVVLNVGSAIMGPQVFEKSLSCVNNLRCKPGRKIVSDHSIYVVDIQDGGTGTGPRRAAEGPSRLLSTLLQKLRPHGRRDEVFGKR